jgi:CHASE2 domain-containing sensor protein
MLNLLRSIVVFSALAVLGVAAFFFGAEGPLNVLRAWTWIGAVVLGVASASKSALKASAEKPRRSPLYLYVATACWTAVFFGFAWYGHFATAAAAFVLAALLSVHQKFVDELR